MSEMPAVPNQCDFCNKSRSRVQKLIVSGSRAICDECVKMCGDILQENQHAGNRKDKRKTKFTNPMKIKQYLDDFVIGQDNAKITLAVGVVNHYKRLFFDGGDSVGKSNIMILGPTGSGKTLLAKTVANYLDVPFVVVDVTGTTEAGYVGDDVETIITRLLAAADGDIELAQQGIVFLDEIDKICKKGDGATTTRDIGGEGVQQALLKLIEGTTISVPVDGTKRSSSGVVDFNTERLLFVSSGAFVGLQEQIQRRRAATIGFTNDQKTATHQADVTTEDLIKFGMIPEFVGRFPVLINTEALTEDQLVHVLTEPKDNLIKQYRFYFESDGIPVEFDAQCLRMIAKQAIAMKLGARALRSIIEKSLTPHMFALPKYKQDKVNKILFTAEVFSDGREPLFSYKSIKSNQIR